MRCANDKIFWCFEISEPTIDLLQYDLQRKSSLLIITDVNLSSKRAFLQKVTFLLNSTTKDEVLFEYNSFFWCFSTTTITKDNV